jgi:hypothetical protein
VCTGDKVEMSTVGGEVVFIAGIIADSLILKQRYGFLVIFLYLCLFGWSVWKHMKYRFCDSLSWLFS